MSFDLKDITDLLPFILENISKCIYIMVICLMSGFFIGKLVEKHRNKPEICGLTTKLNDKENELKALEQEKRQLEEKVRNQSSEHSVLLSNLNYSPSLHTLNELGKLISSNEGRMEITALIELNLKRDKDATIAEDDQ